MPSDHLSLSNRSHAYAQLERFSEALEDAEKVILIRPDWPKVCDVKSGYTKYEYFFK